MPEKLMTLDEVATYTGFAKRTIYNRRTAGTGPRAINTGVRLRFRRADVDAWLESYLDPEGAQGQGAATA